MSLIITKGKKQVFMISLKKIKKIIYLKIIRSRVIIKNKYKI